MQPSWLSELYKEITKAEVAKVVQKRDMKKHIPNTITLFNLFCGCCAVMNIFYGNFTLAVWLLVAATGFDFLDGLVARALKVSSPVGKELDSLADMVSFGVAPGAIMYMLLLRNWVTDYANVFYWPATIGFVITLFSCVRLAKFNLDTRQTDSFIGVPTPAATIFVIGLLMIYINNSFGLAQYLTPALLIPTVLILSYLLVVELPLFSLKFKKFTWKGNEIRFIFLLLSIGLLIGLKEVAFSLIIVIYVLMSVFFRKA